MNLERLNKQAMTFCAVALLFVGSLFYMVSVAFRDTGALKSKDAAAQEYINDL